MKVESLSWAWGRPCSSGDPGALVVTAVGCTAVSCPRRSRRRSNAPTDRCSQAKRQPGLLALALPLPMACSDRHCTWVEHRATAECCTAALGKRVREQGGKAGATSGCLLSHAHAATAHAGDSTCTPLRPSQRCDGR
jgi:hypothetical protein